MAGAVCGAGGRGQETWGSAEWARGANRGLGRAHEARDRQKSPLSASFIIGLEAR